MSTVGTGRSAWTTMMRVTLELATRICEAAITRARELGLRVSVAIVDASGNLVQVVRMDGCNFLSPDIARGKALAAAAWQVPSGDLAARWAASPLAGPGMIAASGHRIVPVAGGVPIVRDGLVIGAVGVSGARSDEDAQVATAGVESVGLARR